MSITAFSLIAYSTVFGNPDLPESSDFSFISLEADVLDDKVGSWFGTLFLAIGAISLFAAALGIVDYVSRLVADAVRCGYTEGSKRWTESRLYFMTVWTMVIVGSSILLVGFDQPLVLVTISTVLGGFIMFVYSSSAGGDQPPLPARAAEAGRVPAGHHRASRSWCWAPRRSSSGVDQFGQLL